ncbi:MAG: carbohydrate-binding domain-containing protein [Betaproteobacteria bacterium]|nr:carbohydrate-binding domain-containing protein [Betaproteobacteria bacterium]
MNRFSFHLLSGAVLAFVFSLFTAPVLAQETFAYPNDFPPRVLQTVGDLQRIPNSVAPVGSDTGKSVSLSDNSVMLNSGTVGSILGAVNYMDHSSTVTGSGVLIYNDSDAVTGNRVTINGGAASGVYGGDARATISNQVVINGGSLGKVVGGSGEIAKDNSVVISGGTVNSVYGGIGSGATTGNSVVISGGTIGDVYGGYTANLMYSFATNNSVTISGGTIKGQICAAYAFTTGPANDNTITILGTPSFGAGVSLYGHCNNAYGGTLRNTLNLHSVGLAVSTLAYFQNLNFYLPVALPASGAMLTVTSMADLTGVTKINVSLDGASSTLQTGDQYILIKAKALALADSFQPASGFVGGYAYTVQVEGTNLVLTIGDKQPVPTRDYTGQWFNVSEDAWGLSVFQNFPGKPRYIFIPWFTYDSSGKAAWLIFEGDNWTADDTMTADVYRYTGPKWGTTPYDNSKVAKTKVGTATLTFTSETAAHFEYTVDGSSRSVDLQKLQ